MWVFDGESWEQDNGATDEVKRPKTNEQMPRFDEFYPELQVVEIVPVPRTNYVPPLPLP
jgi:hypothetical protein